MAGLLEWSNSIRFAMANDPGRQIYQDQIQMHGFLYLNDYFDEIVAGTKHGTLIDLVKTPGRKKAQTAKTKPVSKLRSVDDQAEAKENQPVMLFQPSLVAKPQQTKPDPIPASARSPLETLSRPFEDNTRASLHAVLPQPEYTDSFVLSKQSNPLLSAIAESEETFPLSPSHPQQLIPKEHMEDADDADIDDLRASECITSNDTFHTVPSGSPPPSPNDDPSPMQPPFSESSSALVDVNMDDARASSADIFQSSGTTTSALPTNKHSFPSLPAPIPLRKSIRDHPGIPSAPVPAPALVDKRTSWLQKAREVKALDTTTRSTAFLHTKSTISNPSKRKSDDMLGLAQDEERKTKLSKYSHDEVANGTPADTGLASSSKPIASVDQYGTLDQFRKTMESLGVKGRTTTKSLGGMAAVHALAEARAAAEAKVAGRVHPTGTESTPSDNGVQVITEPVAERPSGRENRLSVSELTSLPRGSSPVFQPLHEPRPRAPSPVASAPPAPVFNKPPPVFKPPTPPPTAVVHSNMMGKPVFQLQPSPPRSGATFQVGLGPRLPSPPIEDRHHVPLSAQSTLDSLVSGAMYSPEGSKIISSTQDTEYTTGADDLDGDDSWMDDKVPDGVTEPWNFAFVRDDETWSSVPTESQKLEPTLPDPPTKDIVGESEIESGELARHLQGDLHTDPETEHEADIEPEAAESQVEEEALIPPQPQGFLGHATKLVSSVLGTSKKVKSEVKSLQLAAAAAKKQQEELEKKAATKKIMENRRHLMQQKKVEEERVKQLDDEKRLREEAERRKREREEVTDKRPLKIAKKDDDNTKKRKIGEAEKKAEPKKAVLSKAKPVPPIPSGPSLSSSMSGQNLVTKPGKKPLAKTPAIDDDVTHPTQMLHSQMAARAKAQLEAAKVMEPLIPSEEIVLPEIMSEYSDSDNDEPPAYHPPEWAQSPELRQALQNQSTINPDGIFGAIRPLRMEEIFQGNSRNHRFRARTSSANWSGADRLTREEEIEYAHRMGFR